jgi:hypothetical protein
VVKVLPACDGVFTVALPGCGVFAVLAMCGALAVAGCSDDVRQSAPDSDGGASNPVCSGDYSDIPATGISLEHDLMPIFGQSCTYSECHDPAAKKAGLMLGDPSAFGPGRSSCYDPSAKWGCSIPEPIDQNLLKSVRDSLLAPSMTVVTPAVPRVTPFDPTKSFLLDKVTGNQNKRGYATCQNQDPSRSQGACGDAMPLSGPSLCEDEPARVMAIAAWIRDGAEQN